MSSSKDDDDSMEVDTPVPPTKAKGRRLPTQAKAAVSDVPAVSPAKAKKKAVAPAKKKGVAAGKKKGKKPAAKKKKGPTKKQLEAAEQKKIKAENNALMGKTGRSPNFTEDEDLLLVKCWVNCTENPIHGTGQSSKFFWGCVGYRFRQLYHTMECFVEGLVRPDQACKNRWLRHIHPCTQKYNKYWRDLVDSKPSGWVVADLPPAAEARYEEMEGKPFLWMHCIDILQKVPKYAPMVKEIVSTAPASDALAINVMGTAMGSQLIRPIGCKAAKKKLKEDASQVSVSISKAKSYQGLTDATSRLVDATENRTKVEGLNKMAELYFKMGMMEKAAACLEEVRDAMAKKPAAAVTIDRADTPLTCSVATGAVPSVATGAIASLPPMRSEGMEGITTEGILQQNNLVDYQASIREKLAAASATKGGEDDEDDDDDDDEDDVATTDSGHHYTEEQLEEFRRDRAMWKESGGDFDYTLSNEDNMRLATAREAIDAEISLLTAANNKTVI